MARRRPIGEVIRRRRLAAKVTRAAMARAWGCTPANVSHVEAGRQPPTLAQIRATSRVLGCDVSELMDEAA